MTNIQSQMLKLKTQGEEERIEVRKMTRFDLTTYIHNRELLVNTEYIFTIQKCYFTMNPTHTCTHKLT